MKSVCALRHVHFEDLGTFAPVLEAAGYGIAYRDVGFGPVLDIDADAPDLLVVLGAPVGVYETGAYPFLAEERELIGRRLKSGRPLLGVCLGAQQIAATLGARVAPTGTKEIGFAPLALSDAGRAGPLRHLEGMPVLHWHGDAFELPAGAVNLASTAVCPNQAFSLGRNVLGLQFHPEADTLAGFERWLVGHACELAAAGIDPAAIRADAARHGPALAAASANMLRDWLAGLDE
jgi:GMP synthase (glutamine-hydrolysing)